MTLKACGAMSERSVLDPAPGEGGFRRVVSTRTPGQLWYYSYVGRTLTERAALSVGATRSGLEVSDGTNERSVDSVRAAAREGCTALATENGLK